MVIHENLEATGLVEWLVFGFNEWPLYTSRTLSYLASNDNNSIRQLDSKHARQSSSAASSRRPPSTMVSQDASDDTNDFRSVSFDIVYLNKPSNDKIDGRPCTPYTQLPHLCKILGYVGSGEKHTRAHAPIPVIFG